MADLDPNRGRETFVGRSREVAEICAGIDGAIAGRGSFFTLAGEPGVGKSRLAQEAAAYARAQGARVVWGRCWEHGGAPAYWPWAQVLRGLSRGIDLAQLSNWMGSSASEIAQIAPEVGNQIGGVAELPSASLGQPDKARFRLFDSLNAFIGKAAEAHPLLIVLDDLHAADPASLRILVAFSRQLRGMCATAIATYRALEVKQLPEHAALIAQAEREGVAFPLLGLDESNIGKFIEAAWGVSANASLVRRLHDLTEGNPFFLNEVLRQMAAEGQLASGASSVPARLTIPRGVIEFIKGLIQPLAEDARNVLDIASVVGRDFNLNRLEAASGLPREAVTDLLDQAESLELVHEVRGAAGRYSFRHALIREALYDALPSARRRRLHRVVAEAIRGLGETREPYAEIAYHYCQSASPGDADAAIEYSRRAARTAEKSLAYEEAAHHLGNAIEALALKRAGDDPFQAELLCDLGEAQVKTGDLAEARKTCRRAADIARRVKRPDLFARAVLAPGRYLSLSGVTDHGFVQLLNEARAMLGDSGSSPLLAQVLARLGIELYWSEREKAVALCQQAADMARGVNDPHALIVALWGRWLSLRNPDSLEQRLADTSEMIAVAESAGERDFALEARFFRVADLLEAGDIVGTDVEHREYLTAETELRDRFRRGLLLEGMRALMDGRLDESETLAKQAFVAGQQSGRPLAPNSFLIQHGMTLWERGRFGELESTLRGFIAQNPLIVFARCALQLILLQKGRPDDARAEFERLAEGEFRFVQRDWNWLPSMFVLADVCADLGDAQRAEVLYRLLAPYASRNATLGNVYTYGSVAYALGRLAAVLGRSDDAEAHFDAALVANRRIRATVWLAHTQCELARVLLTRNADGDYTRAQELIASARQTAEALDLVRLRRKLELFAAGHREEPREAAAIRVRSPGLVEGIAAAEAGSPLGLRAMAQERRVRVERRLAAILATDVVGYSRLMHNDEEATHARLTALLADAVEPAIAEHGGRVVKNTGDGFLAEFPSAVQAVRAAVQFQARIKELTIAEMEDRRIAFRVGINIGDVIVEPHDIFGDGVNIAARLEGIAEPGGICISSSAYEQVIGKVAIEFIDLGEQNLKNIARPVRTYAVVSKGAGGATRIGGETPGPHSVRRLSIVVLPFANLGGDPEQDYFVDGITESLTTDLSRINGSFVIARNTAFTFKGKAMDVQKLGRELNVRYVLEGSVQRGGNRLRVNVQLIDAETGNHLWAERFDKLITDLFDMQDEIVSSLSNALNAQLIEAEARRGERSLHPDAMDLIFQGSSCWNKGMTPEHVAQARGFFERALTLDPGNLEALVGMAAVDLESATFFIVNDRDARFAAAEATLIKALSMSPQHARAHMFLGGVQISTKRAAQGIRECERALVLDRNLADAHGFIGWAKVLIGRGAEAEAHIQDAFRLSPRDTGAYRWMHYAGFTKLVLGADAEAVAWLRRCLEANRNYPVAHFHLAAALALLGSLGEARDAARAGLALHPTFTIRRARGGMSDDPTFRAGSKRVLEGMRMAGVPEE